VAMSLLVAVRQGRLTAGAGRLDVKALQARQEGSRVQVREGLGFKPWVVGFCLMSGGRGCGVRY
jgi:hypothetical protein